MKQSAVRGLDMKNKPVRQQVVTESSAETRHRRACRMAVLIDGKLTDSGAQATKHNLLVEELARTVEVRAVQDMTLHGLPRMLGAVVAFQPNLARWKEHYRANPATFLLRSLKMRRWIAEQGGDLDLVLQVGALSKPASAGSLPYALYLDFTHALTRREWPARAPMSRMESALWRRLESATYRDAVAIFTRSEYVKKSLLQDYGIPADKVSVVGAGVNVPLPDLREIGERPTPTALFIGSDFLRKGGDVLLRAWPEVRRTIPDAELLILGPLASDHPAGVTVLRTTWHRSTVLEAYTKARLFVMPSRCETWGDVFLEAMAYGLPCIGTTADAMPEIIEENVTGFLVPSGDTEGLTQRVISLLGDAARARQFGLAGRARLEQRFLWSLTVDRMLAALDRTLPRKDHL